MRFLMSALMGVAGLILCAGCGVRPFDPERVQPVIRWSSWTDEIELFDNGTAHLTFRYHMPSDDEPSSFLERRYSVNVRPSAVTDLTQAAVAISQLAFLQGARANAPRLSILQADSPVVAIPIDRSSQDVHPLLKGLVEECRTTANADLAEGFFLREVAEAYVGCGRWDLAADQYIAALNVLVSWRHRLGASERGGYIDDSELALKLPTIRRAMQQHEMVVAESRRSFERLTSYVIVEKRPNDCEARLRVPLPATYPP